MSPNLGSIFPPDPPSEDHRKNLNPQFYRVLVLDDSETPMEYAKTIFGDIFFITETDEVFRVLHDEGSYHLGTYTRDIAETKVFRALLKIELAGYPMEFRIVPDEVDPILS